MSNVYFITHPEVIIDPQVAVPRWHLSEKGLVRMGKMLNQPWVNSITHVFSSDEQKAIDGATILSNHLNIDFDCITELGENDRSSTGYLPAVQFEATADAFFLHSDRSIDGWESAVNAQARIVSAMGNLLASLDSAGSVGVISHGAVGTLLLCSLNGWPISREYDQPGEGGGNYFVFNRDTRSVIHGWRPIDDIES